MSAAPYTRKVEIGPHTLYCGDCRQVIPLLEGVDAVASDPPYGIEDIVGGYGRAHRNIANDRDLSVVEAAFRLLTDRFANLWIASFYSPRVENEFLAATAWMPRAGTLIWDKKAPGMGSGIRYQHESIALFRLGEVPEPRAVFSVLPFYRCGDLHPHQKPDGLMRKVIDMLPAQTVLDPFMGSGTTGVACAQMGRRFIGIEIDEKYFDIACERIAAAEAQTDILSGGATEPEPEQVSLLGEAS